MADEADLAQEHIEREMALILAARRKSDAPEATGECHWCTEAVTNARRFCDADCRDAWQRSRAARMRSGNPDGST